MSDSAVTYPSFSSDSSVPETPEAVFLVNRDGVVRFVTPNAAQFYGYEVKEVHGRSLLRFVARDDADLVVQHWALFRGDPARTYSELHVRMLNADGHLIPARVSMWRVPASDDFLLVHHIIDKIRDRLESLYTILTAVSSTLSLAEMLGIVLVEAKRLIPCDASTIYIFERDNQLRLIRTDGRELTHNPAQFITERGEFLTTRLMRESGEPLIINDCDSDPRWMKLPDFPSIRSWMGAPMLHHGEFLGELALDSSQAYMFNQGDAELLAALASQVAALVYNARQYEDEMKRAKRYQVLNEVSQAISRLDLKSVVELVYRRINSLMDATTFFIGLYDKEAGLVRLVGAYDHDKPHEDAVQDAADGMSGLVLRTREKIILLDIDQEDLPEGTIIEDETPRSVLMMPLITQDEVVGVITVQSYRPQAYSREDIDMLDTIAGAVATAIRNAQLYDQTAERLRVLETMHQMSAELASVQELDLVVEQTVKAVLGLFQPEQVRLYLVNEPPDEACLWIGYEQTNTLYLNTYACDIPDSLIEQVCATGQPVILPQVDEQAGWGTSWTVHAAAAYPLQRGDQLLGVLELLHSQPHFFRRDTVRALELLSMQAATALQNARYYQSLRRRLDEVGALQDLARQVSGSRDLDDILHTVVSTMRAVYQCRAASLALYDPESDRVVTRAAVGIEQQYIEKAQFKRGELVAGKVVETGEVIYVPDTQTRSDFRMIDPDIRSLMSVPLTVHDRVIGAMSVDSEYPNAFTPDHERVLTIAGGQIAAVIEMVRLLEEARERAAQLADANAELEALDNLRTELVQNLSHELRSPLALVRGYAGLLRDGELGPVVPDQVEALSIINEKAEAIGRLINDILSLEQIRPETLELSTIDINHFCAQAVTGAQMIYPQHQFTTELASGEYVVRGDKGRLDQVFNNLIGNAAKFTPEGSTITVRTFHNVIDDRIEISVIDQGIGIPPDRLPHIFERFYQGDRNIHHKYGGVGLGLSIVKRIVEAHGGAVWATSQVGTTLTFTLPLVREGNAG